MSQRTRIYDPVSVIGKARRKVWFDNASAKLGKALPFISFGLEIFNYFVAKKEAKEREEEARANRAIKGKIQLSDTNSRLPLHCGRVQYAGLACYVQTANVLPSATARGNDVDGAVVVGLMLADTDEDRSDGLSAYLLMEDVLGIENNIGTMYRIDADDRTITPTYIADPQAYLGRVQVQIAKAGRVAGATRAFASDTGNRNISAERGDGRPKYNRVVHSAVVAWNDTRKESTKLPKVPDIVYYFASKLPSIKRTVSGQTETFSVGDYTETRSPARLLLALYTHEIMGLGITAGQETLRTLYAGEQYGEKIMQGGGGLWEEPYPDEFNVFEGTSYEYYKDAFIARGFKSLTEYYGTNRNLPSILRTGGMTGWPSPGKSGSLPKVVGQTDYQDRDGGSPGLVPFTQGLNRAGNAFPDMRDSRIRRWEFNGSLEPSANVPALFASVLQTMPTAVFPRSMSTGERVLRWLRDEELPAQAAGRITQDTIVSLRRYSQRDSSRHNEFATAYHNAASNSAEETYVYPQEKHKVNGLVVDTPARRALTARDGGKVRTTLPSLGIDNRYHALQINRAALWIGDADLVTIVKNPYDNSFYEVGEVVEVVYEKLPTETYLFINGESTDGDLVQTLQGFIAARHIVEWAVAIYEGRTGSGLHTETFDRTGTSPTPICGEFDKERGVVLLDLDCGADRTPRGVRSMMFPRNFLPQYFVRKGDAEPEEIILPGVIGSSPSVTYTLRPTDRSALPDWLVLRQPTTMVATNVPDSATDIGMTLIAERPGFANASQPFTLRVLEKATQFDFTFIGTGSGGDAVADIGDGSAVSIEAAGVGMKPTLSVYPLLNAVDGDVPTNGTYAWSVPAGQGGRLARAADSAPWPSGPLGTSAEMTQKLEFALSVAPGTSTILTCVITDTDTGASVTRHLLVTVVPGVGTPMFPATFPRDVSARALEVTTIDLPGVTGGGSAVPVYTVLQDDGSALPSWLTQSGLTLTATNPPSNTAQLSLRISAVKGTHPAVTRDFTFTTLVAADRFTIHFSGAGSGGGPSLGDYRFETGQQHQRLFVGIGPQDTFFWAYLTPNVYGATADYVFSGGTYSWDDFPVDENNVPRISRRSNSAPKSGSMSGNTKQELTFPGYGPGQSVTLTCTVTETSTGHSQAGTIEIIFQSR